MSDRPPIAKTTRTTYRYKASEIALALGLDLSPQQWVVLEDGDGDGLQLSDTVDVVIWERL